MSEDKKDKEPVSENAGDTTPASPELQKAKNDYLYLLAEFDNYRKNAIKERSELVKFGSERLVREFLGLLDNFDRALEAADAEENSTALYSGVKMMASDLRALLQRFGVEEVQSEGEKFDPSFHEALSSEPRDDVEPGRVVRVFKKAYKMHDKLLRPAQVVVSAAVEK